MQINIERKRVAGVEKMQTEFLSALIEKCAASMVQLTYRRVGSRELAEDLVQETFLTACCKSDQVCTHENPVAWLYNTLNKLTIREMSRAYRSSETALPEEDPVGEADIALPMGYFLPQGLSGKDRELILMRLEQGLSFAEIAERLGVLEPACRQQMSRAMRKCRTLMEQGVGV